MVLQKLGRSLLTAAALALAVTEGHPPPGGKEAQSPPKTQPASQTPTSDFKAQHPALASSDQAEQAVVQVELTSCSSSLQQRGGGGGGLVGQVSGRRGAGLVDGWLRRLPGPHGAHRW